MATKLHLGDESKIQMPDMFADLNLEELRRQQAVPSSSAPVIGEDYREVRLSAITQRSPVQTRASFDPEHDEEDKALVASLESEGQKQAITLAEIENTSPIEYRLLDGHRRVDALVYLKRETVRAIITRPGTLDADLITLTAQVRKNLTPFEMAQAVSRLKERHGLSLDQIAQKTGMGRRWLTELAALMRADPIIQSEAEKGKLTAEVAFTLSRAPREHQPQLARIAAAAELKAPTARRLVERVVTCGESPDSAALAMGINSVRSNEPVERDHEKNTSMSQAQEINSTPTSKHTKGKRLTVNVTPQSAAAIMADLFPEFDSETSGAFVEAASRHSTSVEALKLAGLLVLGGESPEMALKSAKPDAGTPVGRKILLILEITRDVYIQRGRLSAVQGQMLAGLAQKMNSLRSAAHAKRGPA
jgi:ParB/RepB/Spo0J family partition protein